MNKKKTKRKQQNILICVHVYTTYINLMCVTDGNDKSFALTEREKEMWILKKNNNEQSVVFILVSK